MIVNIFIVSLISFLACHLWSWSDPTPLDADGAADPQPIVLDVARLQFVEHLRSVGRVGAGVGG